jgi:hypothetical protein
MPVVRTLEAFDPASGSWLERLVFGRRPWVLALAALATVVLGWTAAARSVVNADFARMIPMGHPFARTWLEHASV